jgi:hypothetical protein
VPGATPANAGTYACTATNSIGSAMSAGTELSVVDTPDPGRLINLSTRARVGTAANVMIAGFVVGGAGTSGAEPLLIRASGPALALAPFNVPGTLPDPQLTLTNVSVSPNLVIDGNSGWAGSSKVSLISAQVGAFPWSVPTSHDAALVETLLAGNYTAEVAGEGGDSGVALVEIYDATPAGTYTPASPRLVNLSARVQVGTGANVVFAGFVIGGSTARTVLIRASGPALAAPPFDIPGVLPDPQLTLTNVGVTPNLVMAINTGWGDDPLTAMVASSVGAFPWSASSSDCAILVTLPPGNYTAGVAGASDDTGISLVEVYEVP